MGIVAILVAPCPAGDLAVPAAAVATTVSSVSSVPFAPSVSFAASPSPDVVGVFSDAVIDIAESLHAAVAGTEPAPMGIVRQTAYLRAGHLSGWAMRSGLARSGGHEQCRRQGDETSRDDEPSRHQRFRDTASSGEVGHSPHSE
jgi:hypothetical protein